MKKLLYLSLVIVALFSLVLPCFAASATNLVVNVVDLNASVSHSSTVSVNATVTNGSIYYDPDDSYIYIALGQMDDETVYYSTYMPSNYVCMAYAGGTMYEIYNDVGHTSMTFSVTDNGAVDVQLEMALDNYNQYDRNQYVEYGNYRFDQGYDAGKIAMLKEVRANPFNYQLMSYDDYIDFGARQFQLGQKKGIESVSGVDAANEYDRGVHDGVEQSKSLVGLANVGITGIATVFNNFVISAAAVQVRRIGGCAPPGAGGQPGPDAEGLRCRLRQGIPGGGHREGAAAG